MEILPSSVELNQPPIQVESTTVTNLFTVSLLLTAVKFSIFLSMSRFKYSSTSANEKDANKVRLITCEQNQSFNYNGWWESTIAGGLLSETNRKSTFYVSTNFPFSNDFPIQKNLFHSRYI